MNQNYELNSTRARMIAFYLPQFHPIDENNNWWGKGFTEWRNVTTARPYFPGHYQPHIPANLGFYDLRLPETRQAQAELAREHLIEGFCYWHYWFKGKRLLERPFNEVQTTGEPQYPFCLAWANETWSRRWLGEENEVLQKQTYSLQDDLRHAQWLANVFSDTRCIRVNKRPLFLIYRPMDLPDPKRTTDIFRNECVKRGTSEPYLIGINAHCPDVDCRGLGFDGTLNFEPQLGVLKNAFKDGVNVLKLINNVKLGVRSSSLKIYDYSEARHLMEMQKMDYPSFPCIFVRWDNSPRRSKQGAIIINSNPKPFATGLKKITNHISVKPYMERLIFINAWNEWAEGNHLEPDHKYGLKYLQAVQSINSIE